MVLGPSLALRRGDPLAGGGAHLAAPAGRARRFLGHDFSAGEGPPNLGDFPGDLIVLVLEACKSGLQEFVVLEHNHYLKAQTILQVTVKQSSAKLTAAGEDRLVRSNVQFYGRAGKTLRPHLQLNTAENCPEAFLLEMLVVGENVRQTDAAHRLH